MFFEAQCRMVLKLSLNPAYSVLTFKQYNAFNRIFAYLQIVIKYSSTMNVSQMLLKNFFCISFFVCLPQIRLSHIS